MAARAVPTTISSSTATLLFECIDGTTYSELGYSVGSDPNIFKAGPPGVPVGFLLLFPATPVIYLGGSGVTGSSNGFAVPASQFMAYAAAGGDSLYAIAASGSPIVQLLASGQ